MLRVAIAGALSKMLGFDKYKFENIIVHKSVLENAREFAEKNYPREFAAILSGKIEKGTLYVDGLIYQHFSGDRRSALLKLALPSLNNAVGSVHSHPGPSANPSSADRLFFSHNGPFHLILHEPFSEECAHGYLGNGSSCSFSVYEPENGLLRAQMRKKGA